jgi:hypothetical protein
MTYGKSHFLASTPGATLALGLLLLGSAGSVAHAGEVHAGANVVGAGGASTALIGDNSAVTGSPAMLALTERYDGLGLGTLGPVGALSAGLSAVDSRTNTLALGLAYRRGQISLPLTEDDLPGWVVPGEEPTNREFSDDLTLALAVPLADRKVSIGLNGTMLWWKRERRGRGFTGNLDLGLAIAPAELFTVALNGRNLLTMVKDEDLPLAGVLGVRVGDREALQGLIDVSLQAGSGASLSFGLDGSTGPATYRVGYAWDGLSQQHRATWGLGVINEAGGFEYAMQVPVTGNPHGFAGVVHAISVRITPPPFEPEMPR